MRISKKLYIWAANNVINELEDLDEKDFKNSTKYWVYLELFQEFGEKFDLDIFNNYINKRINENI